MMASAEPRLPNRIVSPHLCGAIIFATLTHLHISWAWSCVGLGAVVLTGAVDIEQLGCFAIKISAITALHQ